MELRAVSEVIRLSKSDEIRNDFDAFLEKSLKCISNELTVTYSTFWFHDKENESFSCIRNYNNETGQFNTKCDPITGEHYYSLMPILDSCEIIHQSDSEDTSWDIPQFEKLIENEVQSYVLFPIKNGHAQLGFLMVASKEKRMFDIEDQNIICSVSLLIKESYRENFPSIGMDDPVMGIPEVASNKLDDLIFYTAHNLRHPVTNILSLVDITNKLKDEDELEEIISLIKVEALKLDDVIRVMIAKIEQHEHKV